MNTTNRMAKICKDKTLVVKGGGAVVYFNQLMGAWQAITGQNHILQHFNISLCHKQKNRKHACCKFWLAFGCCTLQMCASFCCLFLLNLVKKRCLNTPKKMISTSQLLSKHLFAGWNTQLEGMQWLFYVAGPKVWKYFATGLKVKKLRTTCLHNHYRICLWQNWDIK